MSSVTLRRRLLLVGAAGVLPLAVACGIALLVLADHQKQRASQSGIEVTRALSSAVDAELQRSLAALQALAADPRPQAGDLTRYRELLERAVAMRPDWTEVIVHDPQGRMLINTSIPPGGPLPPTIETASLAEILRTGTPVVGQLRRGVRGTWRFPVRAPVLDGGAVRYVLTAVVDPVFFVRILSRQRLPQDWVVSIFDAGGLRVARSRRHEAFIGAEAAPTLKQLIERGGPEGAGITYALEGDRVYTAYTRSETTGWVVAIGIPPGFVESAAMDSLLLYGGGTLVSVGLGILAAVLLSRRIIAPMAALSAAARALGRREPLAAPATDIREIREVGDSLVAAAGERDRAEAEREALLVRERQARAAAEALAAVARTINTLDLGAALQNITESACALLHAHVATVFRLDADGSLTLLAGGGPHGTTPNRAAIVPRGTGLVGLAVQTGAAMVSGDLLADPRLVYPADMRARVEAGVHRAGLAVPLVAQGRTTGALFIGALAGRVFSEDDVRLASTFADQAAVAVANAELFDEMQRTNQAKDEFLAMLGHELRNPLNAIGSAASLLGVQNGEAEMTERARAVIHRQVQHLARLVEDLLDVSRVTSGKVVLVREPLDLGELVTSTLAHWRAAGRFARHRVTHETSAAWVDADPTRLEQVVGNLLANALKYTPSGGAIRVRVRAEGAQAMLEVEDTGAGIPPELLGKVFELFVQGERTLDRAQGGLGIGLTLTRALVEMHGGTVEARSAGAGQGAAFAIRLPRIPPPASPVHTPASASVSPCPPRRILVIEDNPDAREMLRAQLERDGHEVHAAPDGPSGLAAAAAVRPDVVLIDIGLPGLDGYDVARRIRATAWGASMLLVALTGYGQADDRRSALEAGCDLHVTKPVMPDRLAEIIARAPAR